MKEVRGIEKVDYEGSHVFMPVAKNKKKKLKIVSFFENLFFKRRRKARRKKDEEGNIALTASHFKSSNNLIDYANHIKEDRRKLEELKAQYYQATANKKIKEAEAIKRQIQEMYSNIDLGIGYLKSKIKELCANSKMTEDEKRELIDELYEIAGIKAEPKHMREVSSEPKGPKHMREVEVLEDTDDRKAVATAKHFSQSVKDEILSEEESEELSENEQQEVEESIDGETASENQTEAANEEFIETLSFEEDSLETAEEVKTRTK